MSDAPPLAPVLSAETPGEFRPPPIGPGHRPFGAFASRNFRLFLSGQFISLCGTWMQSVARGWLVLELTNSPFQVGVVSMAGSLPILLFTIYGGVIADRVDKRRTIIGLQAAMMLEALALGILTATHTITVGWLIGLAIFYGTLTAFEVPTRQSFFADLVPRKDLPSAIAINSATFNLARVFGPALGGAIIGIAGIAACFYLNAASYVAVLWGLFAMRVARPAEPPAAADVVQSLREGVAYVWHNRWPRALLLLATALTIFGYSFLTMLPVFARDALHLGAAGYGVITSAVGVGAAIAAIAVAAYGGRLRQARLALYSGTGFGVALAVTAAAPSEWIAVPLLIVAGVMVALTGIATNTFLQQRVPDHLRGRIMGFYSFVVLGMVPFGSLQSGWLAEHVGIRFTFAVCGALSATVAAFTIWRMRGTEGW